MTVTTDILATIKRLIFGGRHYVDGREVPNYRKGEIMKKKPVPDQKGQGQQKRQRGPKC